MSPRRTARGQAATWPPRAPGGYGPAFPWFAGRPWFGAGPFAYVRLWLAEEVAPGRLIPWLPVAFASGILVYFAAQHEPIAVPAPALALALILAAVLARARPVAFPLLADRSIVALAITPEAFAEDCRRAAVVVSSRSAPPECAALAIDRAVRLHGGALALRRNGNGWEITPVRPDGYDRPWARTRAAGAASSSTPEPSAAPRRTTPRDATPRPADLEADD